MAMANVTYELVWLKYLLQELNFHHPYLMPLKVAMSTCQRSSRSREKRNILRLMYFVRI